MVVSTAGVFTQRRNPNMGFLLRDDGGKDWNHL